ncbi:DNA polymerase III subunit gamma/tau [Aggregatimonas sangjinii]|uniref:DNA polymerase III subunit gamma/tau n=1 Tax=Aggregatimonas sangjinii TaxID=2583587 RepID=A0A5B7SRW6_9FLAO|nr:DNA polymerase III subunit gamma/tau [Aggregatimonas sangjinii]QCW99393.1 DNA polymerase III subunit gamma/tau [Aggregatimonas sangjinii]
MEPFIVSARKYRPQTFKDVVGQQSITNTLTNAIENNHLAQALLFCGPRGVGKTTCARILAKRINDDGTNDPDEDFAFNIFELDAASNNSVDDIRSLIDQVRIPPQTGKYKVYIIDEVHMLSQSAFNAFLKTLEEPPKHAIFILATTEKHKIIPTILSRCQIFDFKRITVKDAANYLKYIAENQGINAEDDALHIIAQKADGAMRDALSIFDRVVSFSGADLTRKAVTENLNVLDYDTYFSATDLILSHAIPELLVLLNTTLALGFDGHHFISGLASHFRDLMVCKHQQTIELLEVGENAKQNYLEQSKKTSGPFLIRALEIANDCDLKYKTSKNQRLLVELTLMKLASIDFDGEKKNPESVAFANKTEDFIAPASFYENKSKVRAEASPSNKVVKEPALVEKTPIAEAPRQAASTSKQEEQVETALATAVAEPEAEQLSAPEEVPVPTPAKKIQLDIASKRVSALSISSLKAKKLHESARKGEGIDVDNLPKHPFTEEELHKHWNEFVAKIDANGQKILASSLATDIPKLKDDFVIAIELPNDTMKKEVEREQFGLMEHLRANLNNHSISLKISVNEETAKKFAFTPEEKYEKLREKNPTIDLLRKTFDLDL